MNRVSKWVVVLGLPALVGAVLAADPAPAPKAQSAQKSETPTSAPARRPRLTLPWSQLTDLSDDQKSKILDIIGKTNEEIAAVRTKERSDIMALLNEDQKKKAEEIEASRPARRGGRRGGAATRPAGQ